MIAAVFKKNIANGICDISQHCFYGLLTTGQLGFTPRQSLQNSPFDPSPVLDPKTIFMGGYGSHIFLQAHHWVKSVFWKPFWYVQSGATQFVYTYLFNWFQIYPPKKTYVIGDSYLSSVPHIVEDAHTQKYHKISRNPEETNRSQVNWLLKQPLHPICLILPLRFIGRPWKNTKVSPKRTYFIAVTSHLPNIFSHKKVVPNWFADFTTWLSQLFPNIFPSIFPSTITCPTIFPYPLVN